MSDSKTRLYALDGLRGLAALSVFLWHNFISFFPGCNIPEAPTHSYFLEKVIFPSPASFLFSGDFAVYVFFVLSGFVLSLKFFIKPDSESLKSQYFRRYVRLMPPAAITVFVAFVILKNGWMYNINAAIIVNQSTIHKLITTSADLTHGSDMMVNIPNSLWLVFNWHNVIITFQNACWQAFWAVWFEPILPGSQFNSNLGTLFLEIIGSYTVYFFLMVCICLKIPKILRYFLQCSLIVSSILVFQEPHYVVFMVGMFVADIYVNSKVIFDKLIKYRLGYLFLVISIYFGSFNSVNCTSVWAKPIMDIMPGVIPPMFWTWICGSTFLLISVLTVLPLQRMLELKMCKFLGTYSYSLYLCHTVFIGSVTCFLFTTISGLHKYSYIENVFLSIVAGLPLFMLFVYAVKKVDDLSTNLSRKI